MLANHRTARVFTFLVMLSMAASVVATGQEATSRDKVPAAKNAEKGLRWGDPGAVVVGFNLIKVPTVQKELNLTAKQKQQVVEAYEQQQVRAGKVVQARAQAQREGRPATGPTPLDTRPTEKAIMAFLSPEQRRRFQQLQFQHLGVQVFRQDEAAKILNFSDEQRAFIQLTFDEMNSSQNELYKDRDLFLERYNAEDNSAALQQFGAEQSKAARQQIDRIRKFRESLQEGLIKYDEKNRQIGRDLDQKALKAIIGVMTRKQRENFDKMMGKPFDFTRMPLVDQSPQPETRAAAASGKSQ